jgi:hypothetical protein
VLQCPCFANPIYSAICIRSHFVSFYGHTLTPHCVHAVAGLSPPICARSTWCSNRISCHVTASLPPSNRPPPPLRQPQHVRVLTASLSRTHRATAHCISLTHAPSHRPLRLSHARTEPPPTASLSRTHRATAHCVSLTHTRTRQVTSRCRVAVTPKPSVTYGILLAAN